jgi:hypothetical protein
MKKIVLILILGVNIFTSCDSILTENVYQRTNFIENDKDAESALAAVYNRMYQMDTNAKSSNGTGLAEDYILVMEAVGVGVSDAQDRLGKNMPGGLLHSKAINSTNLAINSVWINFYSAIAYANNVLDGLDHAPASVTTAVKSRVYGEALFLRSLHYFNLVRMFGALPLYLKPATQITEIPVRQPVSVIYRQIIADLKKSAELLPSVRSTEGRPSKGSAYGLLAKVYLTAASMNKYGTKYNEKFYNDLLGYDFVQNSSLYYDSTRIYCEEVTKIGQFSLVPDFMQQYTMQVGPYGKVSDNGMKFSSESLFEVNTIRQRLYGSMIPCYFSPAGSGYSGSDWGGTRCTKYIFNEFYKAHCKGSSPDSIDYRLDVTFNGGYSGIIRKYYKGIPLVHNPNTVIKNGNDTTIICYPNPAAEISEKWPYLAKYQDINATYVTQNQCNFIYLRYADVLLMQAEAENEINGPSNAYQYVNRLMSRARNGNIAIKRTYPLDWSGMTQDQFREAIWKERNFELLGECHQWYDLVRTGKYLSYIAAFNNFEGNPDAPYRYPGEVQMVSNPNNVLFPIPLNELNVNPKIIQNPGF